MKILNDGMVMQSGYKDNTQLSFDTFLFNPASSTWCSCCILAPTAVNTILISGSQIRRASSIGLAIHSLEMRPQTVTIDVGRELMRLSRSARNIALYAAINTAAQWGLRFITWSGNVLTVKWTDNMFTTRRTKNVFTPAWTDVFRARFTDGHILSSMDIHVFNRTGRLVLSRVNETSKCDRKKR